MGKRARVCLTSVQQISRTVSGATSTVALRVQSLLKACAEAKSSADFDEVDGLFDAVFGGLDELGALLEELEGVIFADRGSLRGSSVTAALPTGLVSPSYESMSCEFSTPAPQQATAYPTPAQSGFDMTQQSAR